MGGEGRTINLVAVVAVVGVGAEGTEMEAEDVEGVRAKLDVEEAVEGSEW